ncbi:MAG: SoxR reducing system RseC family protein [Candidatus Neomarinimicrobiota bacterium]
MASKGIVTDKKGGKIYIRIDDDMDACKGCSAHAICGKKDSDEAQIVLNDRDDLKIDDEVIIEEEGALLIKTSLIVYGLPLLFFAAGILLTGNTSPANFPKELLQFLSGCIGLVLGGFIGRGIANLLSKKIDANMKVKKV